MQQLSADDAQFLFLETENNLGYITSVCIYDPATAVGGRVSYDDFVSHLQGRLHLSKLFTQRVQRVPMDFDFPYWVTDEYFDYEAHVSYSLLPKPGSWQTFCDMVGRFHSQRLNMQRPLWEMRMIDGLDQLPGYPPGSYAIVTKVHHCAIDGASGVRFLLAISDADAQGTPILPVIEAEPKINKPVSMISMLSKAYENNATSPVRMADSILNAFPSLYPMVKKAITGRKEDVKGDFKVPHTRFNRPTSPHKVFDSYTVDMKDLRAIRGCVSAASSNDVVLAVCSGALRRYLLHHDDLPAQSLVAWAPINARPKRNRIDDSKEGGNHLEAMTVSLFTTEPCPQKRLEAISEFSKESKEGKSGASVRVVTSLSKQFPGFTLAIASRLVAKAGLAEKMCNVFVSNISGPKRPIYMNGAKCIGMHGMAPLSDGMGLFIATPSYNRRLSFSITSTREIVPDLNFLMQCFRDSFNELLLLAQTDSQSATKGGEPQLLRVKN